MTSVLDETAGPTNPRERDIRVIDKPIPAEIGVGRQLFAVGNWPIGVLLRFSADQHQRAFSSTQTPAKNSGGRPTDRQLP